MRHTFDQLMRSGSGRKRWILMWVCALAAVGTCAITWLLARYGFRYGKVVGPLSVSVAGGQAELNIWWTSKPNVFGVYDVGWNADRTAPDDESGWMGRLLGGRWRWLMPPGGNEVVAPHAHRVWAIPGFVEYECDTSLWADGGAARSFSVMVWPIPLLLAAAAWPLFVSSRRARRRALGACANCGHRLAVGQSRCPECGAVVGAAAPPEQATS